VTPAEIANALGDATKEGRQWRCRCPVHGGTSFTIHAGKNGKILWTCWSGCDSRDIARELYRLNLLPSHDPKDRTAHRPQARVPQPHDDDDAADKAARLDLSRWLWRRRLPLVGTLACRYLCETRGLNGPFPSTLGFLPAYKDHPPALIAAYGLPVEPEPGVLELPIEAVQGVQLIPLTDDARKLGKPKTIGRCPGVPIVLAPMGDSLGLAIAEGIEDARAVAEATGLGAWAAGGASRFAALADAVPDYADWITVLQDDDPAGIRGVDGLVTALTKRGCWRPEQIERVLLGTRKEDSHEKAA
jgi:putative DNA primase/helicase